MTDKDSFCEQVWFCERAMYSLAFSIVRNDSDAEEVISKAICMAYENLSTLKSMDSFQPWLLRIVHNTAVELIRKNSRIIPMEEVMEIAEEGGDLTTKLALREAVESLKQPYRTVVVLFYYENLSVSKIAQILGTNAAAVRKQLSRARRQLRELLKEDFNA